MKKILLYFSIFFCIFLFSTAQAQERKCATDEYFKDRLTEDPALESRMQEIEAFTKRFLEGNTVKRESSGNIITIPVVVHVLYRTDAENISDEQVQSQIDVLNEDFRRLNDDFDQTLPEFIHLGADYEIEFCLASVDPDGNPTNGIQRKETTRVSWPTNDAMKRSSTGGLDAWDADRYLNVWVCNLSGGVLGYATFPGGNKALDGIVILTTAFGRVGNVAAPFNLGATATHEVGHWLNLRHIWGDTQPFCGNDFVDDTPRANGPNYGCPLNKTSCGGKNMVQNYMDYTNDACMTLFTLGQKARSMALFQPGGFRFPLLSSQACGIPTPTCGTVSVVATNVSNNSADISFNSANNANFYTVFTSTDGNNWAEAASGTGTSYPLSGLQECTSYQVKVVADCDELETSTESNVAFFTTSGSACACGVPQNVTVGNMNFKRATIRWNAVPDATRYEVRRRQLTQNNWTSSWTNITNTQYVMPGHFSNRQYEAQVRAFCPATGWSDWSPGVFYSSATYRDSGGEATRVSGNATPYVHIFPNPARDMVTLEYFGTDHTPAEIRIFDLTGRVSRTVNATLFDNNNVSIDVSGLPNGMYFIQIAGEGRELITKKLMIAR